jgi:hypothetical protein
MAFVDLEKAFDRVPREVLWWSLREAGVEEHTISVIRAMYVGATTSVKVNGSESDAFEVVVVVVVDFFREDQPSASMSIADEV